MGTRRSLDQTPNPGARHPCLAVGYRRRYPTTLFQPPTQKTWPPGGRGFARIQLVSMLVPVLDSTHLPIRSPLFSFNQGVRLRFPEKGTRWRKRLKKLGHPTGSAGGVERRLGRSSPTLKKWPFGARLPPHCLIASLCLRCGGWPLRSSPSGIPPFNPPATGLVSSASRGVVSPPLAGQGVPLSGRGF